MANIYEQFKVISPKKCDAFLYRLYYELVLASFTEDVIEEMKSQIGK